MPTSTERLGTSTLVLTPKVSHQFGASFHLDSNLHSTAGILYDEAIKKSFRPVTRLKSVSDFEPRVEKAILGYARQYDEILYKYVSFLGSSRFKLEYLKQISEVAKELNQLRFASLDLSELYRRHIASCTNAATNYEDLFEGGSDKLNRVDFLLRTTNYGLTLLILLLDGALDGPLWILTEVHLLTSRALVEIESLPEIRKPRQLSGSLVFTEGTLDLTPEIRKPR